MGESQPDLEMFYQRYLYGLLDGDRAGCQRIVQELLDRDISLKDLYYHILQRALYDVGDLWEQNKISVAREHMATAMTEHLLTMVYPRIFSIPRCGRRAVVSCIANEFHQLGAKMVADILELHGWDAFFLGSNTPVSDLVSMVREKRPDLVCLSLSIQFNLPALLTTLDHLGKAFPDLPVIVGGQAFRWGGSERIADYPAARYASSIYVLEEMVMAW